MQWSKDALGVLLWVAELECAWDWVVPRVPIHVMLQGFLCLLSLWPLIQCCPQSPKLLLMKLSLFTWGWQCYCGKG